MIEAHILLPERLPDLNPNKTLIPTTSSLNLKPCICSGACPTAAAAHLRRAKRQIITKPLYTCCVPLVHGFSRGYGLKLTLTIYTILDCVCMCVCTRASMCVYLLFAAHIWPRRLRHLDALRRSTQPAPGCGSGLRRPQRGERSVRMAKEGSRGEYHHGGKLQAVGGGMGSQS